MSTIDTLPPVSARVAALLAQMTLAEKIGQMTLVEKSIISPETVAALGIGGVLSGGGGYPPQNTPAGWSAMVGDFLAAARRSRLGIPLLYGVDAVHGHSNVRGAVIFPHNVGLGAARDADLVQRVARATAEETYATGIRWNYAPTIAVPQDLRWGRTYEGFGENPELVASLGAAFVRGLQGDDLSAPFSVLATAKHYLGDGGTTWGTSTMLFPPVPVSGILEETPFYIDQGDTRLDEATLRAIHLPPYRAVLDAGVRTVMASFSSWNGDRMHAHRYLLTDVLKGELGFSGFIVSDWAGIEQVSADPYEAVVRAINAGIDMSLEPFDYACFLDNLQRAVTVGDVPLARVDDAVSRILTVKMSAGLFADRAPDAGGDTLALIGSAAHRTLARRAVARSLVLLKNEDNLLPLPKAPSRLLVAGQWADDIGLQCGGWTIKWLGGAGRTTTGTTILEGIRATVAPGTDVAYDRDGTFAATEGKAEVGLVCLGEFPYAEGFGDRADLALDETQVALLARMRDRCQHLVVVLISGRPLLISGQLPSIDALVVAWLPGSEGAGVADVLFGDAPFHGRLPYTWPRTMDQIPRSRVTEGEALFPYGYGLS